MTHVRRFRLKRRSLLGRVIKFPTLVRSTYRLLRANGEPRLSNLRVAVEMALTIFKSGRL